MVLHRFDNTTDGRWPSGPLFRDRWGNLSGVTPWGGAYDCGTVFKVNKTGVFSVLHAFNAVTEGCSSLTWLVGDEVGDLFGTTAFGGTNNLGTVFSLDNSGGFKTLHSFTGKKDGFYPLQGLTWGKKGLLYGVAAGRIFEITPSGRFQVVRRFATGAGTPGSLIHDKSGNLFGTITGGEQGTETIFELDPSGNLTTLYVFSGGADGDYAATLIRDSVGNLYGSTYSGGDLTCNPPYGCGVIFKLSF
jgi:uncharacterized repeat protein (TIGR03803 family)